MMTAVKVLFIVMIPVMIMIYMMADSHDDVCKGSIVSYGKYGV